MTRLVDALASSVLPFNWLPTPSHIDTIKGKRILITGAGGSIGAVLSLAISACLPERLILLDSSEHGLYEVDRALRRNAAAASHVIALDNVGDPVLLPTLFEQHQPQIIFHAAAYKHVSLLERHPLEAIANNVCNTYRLAKLALLHSAQHLVLVSTDKAVDPTSIMGATKRLAELIMLTMRSEATRMTAVRLGNVYASRGSVVPLFLDQIAAGGPITVTHQDASRYFMTTQSAVEALLAALISASIGTVLVPYLGEPVNIHYLAQRLIKQSSAIEVEIELTGLRPGEKLEESLLGAHESWLPVEGSQLRGIQSPSPGRDDFVSKLHELMQAVERRDIALGISVLRRLVPEYRPSSLILEAAAVTEHPVYEVHS